MRRTRGGALLGLGAAVATAFLTVSGPPTTAAPATAAPLLESAARDRTFRSPGDGVVLSVLSSRPDTVMGGTVLVRVTSGPATGGPEAVRLTVDDTDVSDMLRPVTVHGGTALEGLVTGLPEGTVEMVASVPGGGADARVELTNHPETGPVFSGPHQEPFVCDTANFALAGGGTLGPALDEDCSAATVVQYVYRTDDGDWKPLPDASSSPPDAAETTTSTGVTVPYVVRVETGTVNRSIYETAVLHAPGDAAPDPWNPPKGWNRRTVHKFGGGCAGGWYVQGPTTAGVLDAPMLAQGYAVSSASLNVFGHNCNDLLAAETMMAVAQRSTTVLGVPDAVLGWGSSGGAYQAHQIADNHPGLLDGVVVSQSFPDVVSGVVPVVTDALLLREYTAAHPDELTREQQLAVSGFRRWESIGLLAGEARRIDPRGVCRSDLPEEELYHHEHNPGGARCEVFAAGSNVYGIDPQTGRPRRPLDNVGVQYGLGALLEGVLDVDTFLHLNEHVGGVDGDGRVVSERTEADPVATAAAHRNGRLLHGGGGLSDVPIVDHRFYEDDLPDGDLHMRYHSFSVRERLLAANGTADNHVMLVEHRDRAGGRFSSSSALALRALEELDTWVTRILEQERAQPGGEPIDNIRAARPESLVDSCWIGTGEDAEQVVGEQQPLLSGQGDRCADAYPVHSSPRLVAGAPLASDTVACALVPFDAERHPAEFTEEQAERAAEVFSEGVCDWQSAGRGETGFGGTWQRF